MGSVYLLSLLILLLAASIGQICGSEVKNETLDRLVEGKETSGKNSNIVTSLFSVYHKNSLLRVKCTKMTLDDIKVSIWNCRLVLYVWRRTEMS
jgi:hypothetical protein